MTNERRNKAIYIVLQLLPQIFRSKNIHCWNYITSLNIHATTYISQTSKRRKLSIAERKLPNLRSMLPWLDFVYKRGRCRAISGPLRFFLHFFFGRLCFYTTDTTTQAQEVHKVSCSFLSTFRVAEVTISPRTKIRSSNVYKAIGPLFFPLFCISLCDPYFLSRRSSRLIETNRCLILP